MQFNIKQACTYYFKDKKLIQKISVIYGLILLFFVPFVLCALGDAKLISVGVLGFLLLYPLSLVFCILFTGYFAANTNQRIIMPDSDLPELNDWKKLFITGGKFLLGMLAWNFIIQIAVILIIMFAAILISSALILKSWLIGGIFGILTGIIIAAAVIIYMLALFAILASFYTDLKMESFFDFKKIKMILFENFKPLLKLIGWSMVLNILFGIGILILMVTIIGTVAIPLLYAFYFLAFCDLQAQLIRYIFKIEQAGANG